MTAGRLLAALALLAAAASACGNKTALQPPELIQPRPATQLVARSTASGVQLMWRRPTEYTGGGRMNDLGGFEIERAPGEGAGAFARVGTVELTDQTRFRPQREIQWTDQTAVPGTRYRYQVVAFTLDGYRSAPAAVSVRFDPTKVDPPGPGQ